VQRKISLGTALGFVGYWLLHAGNAVRVSKIPGYYPLEARAKAAAILEAGPYPWTNIFETWVLLGLLTAGLFAIYRFTRRSDIYIAIYALAALVVNLIVTGTDVGGLAYARGQYTLTTAVGAIVYVIVVKLRQRRASSIAT
jgi:hypothetical protein